MKKNLVRIFVKVWGNILDFGTVFGKFGGILRKNKKLQEKLVIVWGIFEDFEKKNSREF